MTIPVNTLTASESRAPLPVTSPPYTHTGVVRGTAALEIGEKKPESTSMEKIAALANINDNLKAASIDLRFEFDKESRNMITKVMDTQTGELIRQMPSEDAIHVSKVLGRLQGLLFSQKV